MMTYWELDQAIRTGMAPAVVPADSLGTLSGIAEHRLPLAAVRHPLGFFCLPVIRQGELGVCIHVWTTALPGAAATTSAIHCHSWDLLSFVLYGRVTHTLLDVEDDAAGPDRIFEVSSQNDVDELRPTPRLVRCRQRDRQQAGPGASYHLAAGQFHSSTVDGPTEAATVVLGRTTAATDLTIGARDLSEHRLRRTVCDPEETAALATIAIAGIEYVSCSGQSGREGPA